MLSEHDGPMGLACQEIRNAIEGRRQQERLEAFDRWRRYMVRVLDVAIEQCERRNLTASASIAASDLRPPDLVAALIDQLQVLHNLDGHSPRNNQQALDMLFSLQHFYLPYSDVDDPATEVLA